MCERAGREKEAIKPWSASFPSLRHISLLTGHFLHAEQGGAALGGGWWKGPPEQTQCGTRQPGWPGPARFMALSHSFPTVRPLSGASGCIIPSLLLFVTSVYLSFLSLSCSTFPIPSFFFKCLSFIFVVPLFLNLGIFHRPFPFLPDILASCSLRQGVYNSPCKLSCSSGGMSHSLQCGALSQHLCVLSSQHPWPWQHNCMLSPKPPTHTTQGLSAGSSAAECVLDEHQNNVLCHTEAHNTLKIHFVFE